MNTKGKETKLKEYKTPHIVKEATSHQKQSAQNTSSTVASPKSDDVPSGSLNNKTQATGPQNRHRNCHFCHKQHFLSRCKDLRKCSPSDRVQFLQSEQMWLRCLCKGHSADECQKIMITCVVCHGGHNSLTHIDSDTQKAGTGTEDSTPVPGRNPQAGSFYPDSSYVHCISSNEWLQSSMIVPVWLSHKDSPYK